MSSFRNKSTSVYTRPQRDNSGVIFPEFIIYEIIKPIALALSKGEYAKGSRLEPIISSFVGLPQEVIEGIFNALKRQPPRVSYVFPMENKLLPYITIHTESIDTTGTMIGNDGGALDEAITTVETPVILTPSGGAIGGETTFILPYRPVVAWSTEVIQTVSGINTELFEIYDQYTIDVDNGTLTLASALGAGDILTLNKYSYYNLPGGDYFSSIMGFSVVVFIDTNNPLVSKALSGIVWRELMVNSDTLEEYGLTDVDFSIRTNSIWDQTIPPMGIRCECVLSGKVEWHAYLQQISARTITFDLDSTDGTEGIVLYEDELASIGVGVTVDPEDL